MKEGKGQGERTRGEERGWGREKETNRHRQTEKEGGRQKNKMQVNRTQEMKIH